MMDYSDEVNAILAKAHRKMAITERDLAFVRNVKATLGPNFQWSINSLWSAAKEGRVTIIGDGTGVFDDNGMRMEEVRSNGRRQFNADG